MAKDLFGRLQDELESREEGEKETLMSTLTLPAPLQKIVTLVIRQGEASIEQVAARLKSTPQEVEPLLNTLVAKKFLQVEGSGQQKRYKPYLGRTRGRRLPVGIWDSLDGKLIKK